MILLQIRDGGYWMERINKMHIKITWMSCIQNRNSMRGQKDKEIFKV